MKWRSLWTNYFKKNTITWSTITKKISPDNSYFIVFGVKRFSISIEKSLNRYFDFNAYEWKYR